MARVLFPILLLLLAACGRTPALTADNVEGLVVRHGTSFGMCLGYCLTELSVSESGATLTRSSREPDRFPTLTHRLASIPGGWDSLAALADPARLAALRETYGCPDCADGGAEWVEVERGGERRRVTFEHGATIPEIATLVTRLREVRDRFPPAPEP